MAMFNKMKKLFNEGYPVYRVFNIALLKLGLITHKAYKLNWDCFVGERISNRISERLPKKLPEINHKEKKTAWMCWLQGIENAPELVKACFKVCDGTELAANACLTKSTTIPGIYGGTPVVLVKQYEEGFFHPHH